MAGERRRHPRVGLGLPIRVRGFLGGGHSWEELSTTIDISPDGACFPLTKRVALGQLLHISLALPKQMRRYDLNDASYRIYALVRGVYHKAQGVRVGVMFFGKYPPRGFHDRPTTRFLLPGDALVTSTMPHGLRDDVPLAGAAAAAAELASDDGGLLDRLLSPSPEPTPVPFELSPEPGQLTPASSPVSPESPSDGQGTSSPPKPVPEALGELVETNPERRHCARLDIFVNFTLAMVDAIGDVREELTVADNVGRGGARVMTTFRFQIGDVVLLREASGGGFETRAEVRAISRVQPAFDRLHLRFVDNEAPDRLLRL